MNRTPRHLGKYELLERLGYGGIAEVWKALDTQLQRFVAIKLLQPNLRDDPQFISRFQAEARMIASLHHPNIVQIHDFQVYASDDGDSQEASIAYMVMDYVEGQTLASYIRETSNRGKFPSPTELINLFTSISLAIDYAHRHNMIHRDIKPANILLDMRNTTINPMGEPILTDFGVAKLLSSTYLTLSEARLGTPLYTSPEQASGYAGNERSDLYALGVILYEITTGAMPFRGETPHDVIMQHLYSMPPAPELINPAISPALSHVIMRSLAKDPVRRYSSAAAMTIAIAEALHVPAPESLNVAFATKPDIPGAPTVIPFAGEEVVPQKQAAGDSAQSGRPSPTPTLARSAPEWMITSSGKQAQPADPPLEAPVPADRRRRFYTTLLVALVALLLISALGALFYLPSIVAPSVSGQAFYVSSGQFNLNTVQGIDDQLQIDLKNVPAPKSGDSYYVWLLGDIHPDNNIRQLGAPPIRTPVLLTNNLPVQNGTVHYLYDGSHTQHYDLLSATSRLLITEQAAGQNAGAPSTKRSDWRYYAQLPQNQIPGDSPGFTAMTHFRHLFYDEPDLHTLGLNGGLDFWLTHNAEKIVELTTSARDDWNGAQTSATNITLMNNLYISILDYLDGTDNVNVDLPPGTPVVADALSAKVALISTSQTQQLPNPHILPGYVDHTIFHVGQIGKATDLSPQQRQLAANAISELEYGGKMLQYVRQDALKLYQMRNNPAQIQQDSTRTLLDDMTTNAIYAYVGQVNPATNQAQPAIQQAHYDIQRLSGLSISTNLPEDI
jgi:eukaryotic-like serine/threonine-protein kinase